MPAQNEIVPLDAAAAGPARGAVPSTSPPSSKAKSKNTSTNAEALTSQERRTRLVLVQKRHSNFQLFYALFGLVLMVVQIEYVWFANTKNLVLPCPVHAADECPRCRDALDGTVPIQDGRMILHALRVLISFSTAILLYYIYLYYAIECEVMKIKNIVPPQTTLLSSSLRCSLVLELLVLCIHPFPGLEAIDPRWPNLVVTTSLLMFCRIGLVLRAVQARSSFNSNNGWFISALTNVDFTAAFFVKSTLKNHPTRWLLLCAAVLIFVAGYALYVVERFLCAFGADACCEPMPLVDALWTLVMTALTIGYGDTVPHTTPGRLLAVATGALGTLSTAVTIAVMSNALVLTRSEHKVNAFLKKDDNRRLIADHAARAIQAFVQLIACQRRHHHGLNSTRNRAAIQLSERKLYNVLQVYRCVKRRVTSHDVSDPMDKQMTMLEMMEVNVEYIRTKIEDLSELFHSQTTTTSTARHSNATDSKYKLVGIAPQPATTATASQSMTSVNAHQIQQQQQHEVGAARSASRTGSVAAEMLLTHSSSNRSSTRQLSIGSSSAATMTPAMATASSSVQSSGPSVLGTVGASASSTSSASAVHSITPSLDRIEQPHTLMRMHSNLHGSSRALHMSETDDTPEWAVMLEATLQSIVTQLGRVTTEVESIQTRVSERLDDVEARVINIEKKFTAQSAFRDIARAASRSEHFKRSSFVGTNGGADTNEHSGGASDRPHLATIPQRSSRRTLFDQRRPSIRSFLTQKDLDEFQNDDAFE